jgi:hypothetical protein
MDNLAPDLAFKVLKQLSVPELLALEPVRVLIPHALCDRYDTSILGFEEVARDSALTRSLEVPLYKADCDGSNVPQGPSSPAGWYVE